MSTDQELVKRLRKPVGTVVEGKASALRRLTSDDQCVRREAADAIDALARDLERAQARIAELEAGLRPFAEEAERRPWLWNDANDNTPIGGNGLRQGHLRTARSLLTKEHKP